MKNIFIIVLCNVVLFAASSCEKCFNCHNQCKVCYEHHSLGNTDTTLTITVCSNTFGREYFVEYLDSLTSPSLGWVCNDTASNYTENFCTGTMKKTYELVVKSDEGLICNEE